jgi:predicted dehydrogenase
VNDPAQERATNLARTTGAEVAHDWHTLTERSDIDAIVVQHRISG